MCAAAPKGSERNLPVWGDNKLVLSSLLADFAGRVDLIYFDPPFATGADFSHHVNVGDVGWLKEPSIPEEHAYRDTWGAGYASYMTMLFERLTLMRDLLSPTGIYLHLDWRAAHYGKLILDELFGPANFKNEIVWRRARTPRRHSLAPLVGARSPFVVRYLPLRPPRSPFADPALAVHRLRVESIRD